MKPAKDTSSLDTHIADQDKKQEKVPCSPLSLLKDDYKTAVIQWESGDFTLALQSAKRALDITRTLFGKEHP